MAENPYTKKKMSQVASDIKEAFAAIPTFSFSDAELLSLFCEGEEDTIDITLDVKRRDDNKSMTVGKGTRSDGIGNLRNFAALLKSLANKADRVADWLVDPEATIKRIEEQVAFAGRYAGALISKFQPKEDPQ